MLINGGNDRKRPKRPEDENGTCTALGATGVTRRPLLRNPCQRGGGERGQRSRGDRARPRFYKPEQERGKRRFPITCPMADNRQPAPNIDCVRKNGRRMNSVDTVDPYSCNWDGFLLIERSSFGDLSPDESRPQQPTGTRHDTGEPQTGASGTPGVATRPGAFRFKRRVHVAVF